MIRRSFLKSALAALAGLFTPKPVRSRPTCLPPAPFASIRDPLNPEAVLLGEGFRVWPVDGLPGRYEGGIARLVGPAAIAEAFPARYADPVTPGVMEVLSQDAEGNLTTLHLTGVVLLAVGTSAAPGGLDLVVVENVLFVCDRPIEVSVPAR